jgi:hypothetical protein
VTSAWALLATSTPSPGPSPVIAPDPDRVTPGVAGFLVMFLLALATVVLLRSMTKHLRKVRYSPDPAAADDAPPPGTDAPAGADGTDAPAGADGTDAPAGADGAGDRPQQQPGRPERAGNGAGPTTP